MVTPFWDTYLTNKDFDSITDFENFNLKIQRVGDSVEISFKHTYSVNVWIYQNDGFYYVSANHKALKFNNLNKNDIIREREFFEKLILYRDRYEFIWCKNVDIYAYYEESIKFTNNILTWIDKYNKLINEIDENELCIELSAGIDTRILTYFWRYSNKKHIVYTKPKSTSIEYPLVKSLVEFIQNNFNTQIELKTKDCDIYPYKLSGNNIIHGYFTDTTIDDIKDKINNSKYQNKAKHIVCGICPFYDKLYLSLKGNFQGQIKLFLYYLLCKDKALYKEKVITNVKTPITFDENIYVFTKLKKIEKNIKRLSENNETLKRIYNNLKI